MTTANMIAAAAARATSAAQRFGVSHLTLNAPMHGAASVEMAAAVSRAGGLGVLAAQQLSPDDIEAAGRRIRQLTDRPFAVALEVPPHRAPNIERALRFFDALTPLLTDLGLPVDAAHYGITAGVNYDARFQAQFDAALAITPAAVMTTCGGLRECFAEALSARNIRNAGVATTLREAKVLRAAGVDAVIVQGLEAGGPRSNFEDPASIGVGTALLTTMVAQATALPVISSGGIYSAEQALGLCLAGASGVMVGTALLTTQECAVAQEARRIATWATASDTLLTNVFSGRLARVVKCPLSTALADYEPHAADRPLPNALFDAVIARARYLGREDLFVLPAGQGIGRSRYPSTDTAIQSIAVHFEDI